MAQATTNYASKYESGLVQAYQKSSILTGKTNDEYTWDGVKTIHVYSVVTQPLTNYTRSGTSRYGTPQELEDDTQYFTVTQDKSFSLTIDKGNQKDKTYAKNVGKIIKAQIAEQVTPFWDKYALNKWATDGVAMTGAGTALTKSTVIDPFIEARKQFVNWNIPMGNDCFAYVNATTYALLLQNDMFVKLDKLAPNAILNGVVGTVGQWHIVEVPDDYLPSTKQILFTHKKEVFNPVKIAELKHHIDPPGISGDLIEGRYYGDAFIRKVMVNSTTYDSAHPAGQGTFAVRGVLNV